MCDTCGCGSDDTRVRILKPGENENDRNDNGHGESMVHEHEHAHGHGHGHSHDHGHGHTHDHGQAHNHDHGNVAGHVHDNTHSHETEQSSSRKVEVSRDALDRNSLTAERNRGYFEARGLFVLNLVSAPGSGKTSLLERTIRELGKKTDIRVIEGDQQTLNDAERIRLAGVPVVQVNTGEGCHLDASMVRSAYRQLEIPEHSVLMIENVGNLVCPALFDLGESARVVIMSVTEGEDKALKYPMMFQSSDLCILNKTDLLPYVDFDMARAREYIERVHPGLDVLELSVRTGEGMDAWYEWISRRQSAT